MLAIARTTMITSVTPARTTPIVRLKAEAADLPSIRELSAFGGRG
jgi:hypothetical protein